MTEDRYGNYTCVATNKLGTANASVPLIRKLSVFLLVANWSGEVSEGWESVVDVRGRLCPLECVYFLLQNLDTGKKKKLNQGQCCYWVPTLHQWKWFLVPSSLVSWMLIVYYGCTFCTCVGGSVSAFKVYICMSTGKKQHLKRKSSFEAASQLQRRLHRSVVLSWMPSRGLTQWWKGSESQLLCGFCHEASNKDPNIQRSNCWCVSDGLWTFSPDVCYRKLKHWENKSHKTNICPKY